LRRVHDNLTSLLAVELLVAVRGIQLRNPLRPSPAGRVAIAAVSDFVGATRPDIVLAPCSNGPASRSASGLSRRR
jgi:histidine ammonia-lyase